jgi:hypothetical protein
VCNFSEQGATILDQLISYLNYHSFTIGVIVNFIPSNGNIPLVKCKHIVSKNGQTFTIYVFQICFEDDGTFSLAPESNYEMVNPLQLCILLSSREVPNSQQKKKTIKYG